nr:hypothetical protein [Saccharothrix sp.]
MTAADRRFPVVGAIRLAGPDTARRPAAVREREPNPEVAR